MELPFFRRNTSLLSVSRDEQRAAVEALITSTSYRRGYYLLLAIAVCIVTPGLLIDNSGVIIGGMVIAPLLTPILLLALAIVTSSRVGVFHALKVLVLSILLIVGMSAFLAWMIAHASVEIPWIPRQIDPRLYAFIAFCSGVAAAFAWVKKDFAPTIAGIAISVSLLPPLCAAGSALALAQRPLAINAIALFLANVIGIVIGAVVVFAALGFFHTRKIEEKIIAAEAKEHAS